MADQPDGQEQPRHEAVHGHGEPLRPDQQELFEQTIADDGNCILVAQTGFGKTRVAFALVAAALERHPGKQVTFLCPTVPLVGQQYDYWRQLQPILAPGTTSAAVAGTGGGAFGRASVTFGTPAKFTAWAGTGHRRGVGPASGRTPLASLSLLVIDECHHARRLEESNASGGSDHPFAQVAAIYREAAGHERPKLLGLTASPGATDSDVAGLSTTLLARFLHQEPTGAATATTVVPVDVDGRLQRSLALLGKLELRWQQTEKFELVGAAVGLAALRRAVGSGPVLRNACATLPPGTVSAEMLELDSSTRHATEADRGLSPVYEVVLEELRAGAVAAGDDAFRAIVFVSTVAAANVTVARLSRSERSLPADATLRPVTLLGQGTMTMAAQTKTLKQFRRGKVNVLVATSIAEEGLDIQSCGLVIRTEPPRTIISNIQGRGRARRLDARYVIVALGEGEASEVARLAGRELDATGSLRQCIAAAGSRPCLTSWSQFSAAAFDEEIIALSGSARFNGDWKSRLNVFLLQRDRPDPESWRQSCVYDATSVGPPCGNFDIISDHFSRAHRRGTSRASMSSG